MALDDNLPEEKKNLENEEVSLFKTMKNFEMQTEKIHQKEKETKETVILLHLQASGLAANHALANHKHEEDEDYFCESNKSMVSMKDGAVFACEGSSPITVASPSPSSRDMRRVGVRRRREGATAEVSEVLTRSAMYQLVKSLWSVEELNKASAISSSPFNSSSSSSASSSSPMDLSRGTLDDEISDVLEALLLLHKDLDYYQDKILELKQIVRPWAQQHMIAMIKSHLSIRHA